MPPRILLQLTAFVAIALDAAAFAPSTRSFAHIENRQAALLRLFVSNSAPKTDNDEVKGEILDAEILHEDENKHGIHQSDPSNDKKKDYKSLFDISMDETFADSDLKDTRIPFLDMTQQTSIDVRLAFMAKVDGVDYGVGVPFDAAAAILVGENEDEVRADAKKSRRAVTIPDPSKKLDLLCPDDEANEEIMNIMATQLHDQISSDLKLIRSPRVLTISGPIDEVISDNWKEELLPKPFSIQELLDPLEGEEADDDGQRYFLDFMKKELGEEAVNKVMAGDSDPEWMNDEILDLFNMPSIEEIEKDRDAPEKMEKEIEDKLGNIDRDIVGLRLVAYFLADGSSYSLVKLLKPVSLVAKYVDSRFEFLAPKEQDIILPKLQELYQDDLDSAGLELATS